MRFTFEGTDFSSLASSFAWSGASFTPFSITYSNVMKSRGETSRYSRQASSSFAIGYASFTGMMRLRISSLGACRLTARATGRAWASLRMLGTTPEVESVTRRRDRPYAWSSSMIDIASTTGWKLLSGSPMPIMTTLLTGRGEREGSGEGSSGSARRVEIPWRSISSRRRLATQSCPMISPTARSRLKPWRPVEQNLQSRAQPTCDETQSVPRSSSGM
jgi:hypothetical protein